MGNRVGNSARALALWMVVGTLIGSVAPEFGNLIALQTGQPAHYYNACFLVAAVVVLLGCFVAFYSGLTKGVNRGK